jgi:malonate decarboxylase delta subunit
MEHFEFVYPARNRVVRRAHIGVVSSGDLEVLLEPSEDTCACVSITTSVDGSVELWNAVLDRFFANCSVAARILINDAGATPGIVLLRLEQAVEASSR